MGLKSKILVDTLEHAQIICCIFRTISYRFHVLKSSTILIYSLMLVVFITLLLGTLKLAPDSCYI